LRVYHKGIVKVHELEGENAIAMNTRIVSNYFFRVPIDSGYGYAFCKWNIGTEEFENRFFGAPDGS
jgi:hypothetical protein